MTDQDDPSATQEPSAHQSPDPLPDSQPSLAASSSALRSWSAAQLSEWRWDAATDTVSLGRNAASIAGVSAGSPVPRGALEVLIHDDDRNRVMEAVGTAIINRSEFVEEFRFKDRAGVVVWICVHGEAEYGAGGQVLGMAGLIQDVSQRKSAELALQEERHILEVLNKTGMALNSNLDLRAIVQAVTDAGTELSGAKFGAFFYNTRDEASGDAYMLYTLSGAPRDAFEHLGKPRATSVFGPTFEGGPPIRSDDITNDPRYGRWPPHHGMPPGHLAVRSYLAASVVSRSGEVIGGLFFGHPEGAVFTERAERLIVGLAAQAAIAIDNARLYEIAQRDATRRRELLESEQAARVEAERSSAIKDDFLATLSHELRTPLNAILGWSQVLQRSLSDHPEVTQGLDAIVRNARVQTQLIEDLLDMSRIAAGKMRLEIQSLDPVPVVNAAVDALLPAVEAKNLRLQKIIDPSAGPVLADPARLQQIIANLLSNAIKFTPRGGKVQIIARRINSHIELAVSDTGIGIAPEFLPHIFTRFRQHNSSATRTHGGLGLGLSIVKHLVELHGGSIHAESAGEGQGATLTVHLPVVAVRSDSVEKHDLSQQAGTSSTEEISIDLRDLTILVVDDEADTLVLLERLLIDCHATVIRASSGPEALELVKARSLDLLVSDIGMPGLDGYELLRQIRMWEGSGKRIPAVALTAYARSADRTRAFRVGFAAHMAKPVEPTEFLTTVASVLGRL